ncbi:MAG: hydrolase TatD [Parcubacteria group bacterium CG08_land_8_20_14_0_20_43_9]|nr:MAG: hydrolase TatD [Parcubacteria group bacterium CG08_land_8_20_14_0_20_43_9]
MYFDTHAHLNFPVFAKNRDKLIEECLRKDFWMLNVGTNLFTSKKAIEIARNYDEGIYASVGLHPINFDTGLSRMKIDESEAVEEENPFESEFDYEAYKKIASDEKVVAIGEIGLDYYWKPKTKIKLEKFKEAQNILFRQQVKLAKELDLPIIIHCRMAHNDLLEILAYLSTIYGSKFRGVIHCFTGNWEQAKTYMAMGFHIGFNGIIFKFNQEDIIKKISLDKVLIETDCPYLLPPKYQKKINDPMGVKYIAEEIAKIKNIGLKEVADQTTQSGKALFGVAG